MDFSRLQRYELLGVVSSVLLLISIFLPWYSLTDPLENGQHLRAVQHSWVCGTGAFSCSAWDTFSIVRILLLAAAVAPLILSYLVVSAQKGRYPTGEFTMTVGLAVIVLVGFNGLISKPGATPSFGVSLDFGYFVALIAGLMMATAGALRSLESGGGAKRKPPATY